LTKSGEIKPFFSVSSPLLPQGIHVTTDNYIIVGVTEPGNIYTPTDKSTRALLIFGMDGKNCLTQTEVGHCLMSMSCLRYNKKSALWL
jgi:hypothetical protein